MTKENLSGLIPCAAHTGQLQVEKNTPDVLILGANVKIVAFLEHQPMRRTHAKTPLVCGLTQ